jgi:hypothetical protein
VDSLSELFELGSLRLEIGLELGSFGARVKLETSF